MLMKRLVRSSCLRPKCALLNKAQGFGLLLVATLQLWGESPAETPRSCNTHGGSVDPLFDGKTNALMHESMHVSVVVVHRVFNLFSNAHVRRTQNSSYLGGELKHVKNEKNLRLWSTWLEEPVPLPSSLLSSLLFSPLLSIYGLGQCRKINWSLWVIRREKDRSDWFQWYCWKTSVYMELSKQMLMESSAAGCFLGLPSLMTQWPVEFGCSLQQSAFGPLTSLVKVFAVTACHGKHIILYSMILEGCGTKYNWKCSCHWENPECRTITLQDSR